MLNVAKCNLGKVNLKSTRPAVFLTNMHEGWPQGFALPCADESAISAICSSFGIIAVFLKCFVNNLLRSMSRSTPNSMDAALFVADTQAALSGSASQPNSSSSAQQTFPPISSCFQLCPILAGFPRHRGPGGESCVCIWTSSSCSLQHCGCLAEDNVKCSVAISDSSSLVAAQALGPHTLSLLAIGSSLPSHSPSLTASSQPGRPAFVVPSFVATFVPLMPSLVSFGTSASLASALQVVSTDSTFLLLPQFCIRRSSLGRAFPQFHQAGQRNHLWEICRLKRCSVSQSSVLRTRTATTLWWLRGFIRLSKEN